MVRSQSTAAVSHGIDVGERIRHHMRRGEGDAIERALKLGRERPRRREAIGLEAANDRRVGNFSDK